MVVNTSGSNNLLSGKENRSVVNLQKLVCVVISRCT